MLEYTLEVWLQERREKTIRRRIVFFMKWGLIGMQFSKNFDVL